MKRDIRTLHTHTHTHTHTHLSLLGNEGDKIYNNNNMPPTQTGHYGV